MSDLPRLQADLPINIAGVDPATGNSNFFITASSNGAAGDQLLHTQTPDTTTATSALGALNATISIAMAGLSSVGVQLAAGTLIGTITPQCSIDGGATWVNCAFYSSVTGVSSPNFVFATANPQTILSILPLGGSSHVQVIVTAYTSGTANTLMRASVVLGEVSARGTIQDPQTFNYSNIDQRNELRVTTSVQLIGAVFVGTILDTNMWSLTSTGSGASTISDGIDILSTGATANSSIVLNSVNRARFISGTINACHVGVRLGDTGTVNNIRNWGAYDSRDGVYFQLNGTTPGIGIRNNSVNTIVTVLNGPHAFVLDTNFHTYEIQYSSGVAYFYQDSNLIHTHTARTTSLTSTPHLYLGFENTNSGGGTSNVSLYVRNATILRYGEEEARARYFHPIYNSRVQNTTGSTNGPAASLIIPINPTLTGDLIVVTAAALASTLTVTDSASQTYSTAITQTSGSTNFYTFYVANTAAGVTSITLTPAASDRVIAIIAEYSNIVKTSPLDQTSTNTNLTATSWTSNATAATTQGVELLIGSALDFTKNTDTFTAGSGWTAVNTIAGVGAGNHMAAFQEDQYVISTGTYAATGTSTIADTILANIATFVFSSSVLSNGLTLVNAPTVITIGAGTLRKVIINTMGTGSASVTLYDNTTNSGQIIAIISLSTNEGTVDYDLDFNNGLTMVVNSSTADFTVVYD